MGKVIISAVIPFRTKGNADPKFFGSAFTVCVSPVKGMRTFKDK
jgi:hypothetical protein